MKITEVTITPDMAKALLKKNTANRTVRDHHVEYLSKEIRRGAWISNIDPIAVSTEGKLLNGQHRLLAIIRASRPVVAMLAEEVDPAVFDITDRGLARSIRDVTGLPNILVADVSLLAHFMDGSLKTRLPIDILKDAVVWWRPAYDTLWEACAGKNTKNLCNAAVRVAFALRWAIEESPDNRKYILTQYDAMVHFDAAKMSKATASVWHRFTTNKLGIGQRNHRMIACAHTFYAMDPRTPDTSFRETSVASRMEEITEWITLTEAAFLRAPKDGHPYLYSKKLPQTRRKLIIAGSAAAPNAKLAAASY